MSTLRAPSGRAGAFGWGRLRWAGMAVVAIVLTACSHKLPGPTVGKPFPSYRVATLAGDSISVASFKGKVVLLNLWATWCEPCRHETPYLESLYKQRRADGLVILGVSMDTGDSTAVDRFVKQFGLTYTVARDPQLRAMDLFHVMGLPASFLVDRNGVLRWLQYGPISNTDHGFLNALETLLK